MKEILLKIAEIMRDANHEVSDLAERTDKHFSPYTWKAVGNQINELSDLIDKTYEEPEKGIEDAWKVFVIESNYNRWIVWLNKFKVQPEEAYEVIRWAFEAGWNAKGGQKSS